MADTTTKQELTQERIDNFKENYTNLVNDSLDITEVIDEKNSNLNLHGKLMETMGNDNTFMDICELISDYDVKENKFTNEDLYNYIIETCSKKEE